MPNTAYKYLILISIILFFNQIIHGQGWKKVYSSLQGGTSTVRAENVFTTEDGGYVTTGPGIAKVDAIGDLQWNKSFGPFGYKLIGSEKLADGDLLTVSKIYNSSNYVFTKYDSSGDSIWGKTYFMPAFDDYYFSLTKAQDGGFAIATITADSVTGNYHSVVIKYTIEGDVEWQWQPVRPGIDWSTPYSISSMKDGGFVISGEGYYEQEDMFKAFIGKLDENGNFLWERSWYGTWLYPASIAYAAIGTKDGGVVVSGLNWEVDTIPAIPDTSIIFVKKLDKDGNELWTQEFNDMVSTTSFPLPILAETSDGGYVCAGTLNYFSGTDSIVFLKKMNSDGQLIWTKLYDYHTFDLMFFNSIKETADLGFIIRGASEDIETSVSGVLLLKTDSLGNVYSHYIVGNAYRDQNTNCSPDNEPGVQKFIVKAVGEETFYAITDTAGYYEMLIDTGSYEVSIVPTTYWETCEPSYTIVATTLFDTTTQNFPLQPMIDCPLMEVSIGTPFLRICSERAYSVSYCNHGTVNAGSVTVQVTLDPNLQYLNATAPLFSQNGQVLLFDIGDVALNDCGSFQISCMLGCDTSLIGETLCSGVHIFPDSICENTWTGANLVADGLCQNDSIKFSILNTGGDMPQAHEYIVIEDNIILRSEIFQLPDNETLNIDIEAQSGATYYLLAAQDPNLPPIFGNPTTTAVVEGCVGPVNPGAFNQFPQDDGEPWLDIDCHEVVASFDPNDKSAVPTGWQDEHFIAENTQLDYLIRFQNTGTDTAFRVVLIDTLSSFLDPATIRPGASSHPYTFELSGQGVAKFIFENILLPDSTTNEAASHGFVQFHVAQKPDNQPGTVIENTAGIYFDYNAPVYTNTTFHTIREPWVQVVSGTGEAFSEEIAVKVSPNPMGDWAIFELLKPLSGESTLILWDALGKEVLRNNLTNGKALLQREGMAPGLYFFSIESDGEKVRAGKLIVK